MAYCCRIILVLASLATGSAFPTVWHRNTEKSRRFRRASSTFCIHLSTTRDGEGSPSSDISFDALLDKNVLVVGGSGRVGGSVTTQLITRGSKVTVGGTSEQRFEQSRNRWKKLFDDKENEINDINFVLIDRESSESVCRVLESEKFDLVVHTAGPFQGKVKTPNGVIDGCISNGVPYIDVCDDYCTASAVKTRFGAKAEGSGVPCIISTGCWPGVSSLMASLLIRKVLQVDKSLKPEDLSGT